jgi:pimeloyl-ACP methyl ester carboxylesterase
LVLLHGLLDCAMGWRHLAAVMRRPCFAVDLPGFGDSDRPARNRISAYAEDVQAALAALDVHDLTLVGHSLGGAVATELAERLRDDVAALVLIAPAGFGRIRLAEAIQLPGIRTLVHHALPLALANPVTAFGAYVAVVGNGHLPDPELAERLRKNAFRWAPGAECANEAITVSGLSPSAFYRRQLEYAGPVQALWGDCDRLVPLAHRQGVPPPSRRRRSASGREWVTILSASGRASLHSSSKPPAAALVRGSAQRASSPSVRVYAPSGPRRSRWQPARAICRRWPSDHSLAGQPA